MTIKTPVTHSVPRIEYLRVKNYQALCDLELKEISPLTVFLGPNGSGKSTIFDVFAFLSECFITGLRRAWDKRGRFRELRTRGEDGPIVIELKYRLLPIIWRSMKAGKDLMSRKNGCNGEEAARDSRFGFLTSSRAKGVSSRVNCPTNRMVA
jgi:predicted ATPase